MLFAGLLMVGPKSGAADGPPGLEAGPTVLVRQVRIVGLSGKGMTPEQVRNWATVRLVPPDADGEPWRPAAEDEPARELTLVDIGEYTEEGGMLLTYPAVGAIVESVLVAHQEVGLAAVRATVTRDQLDALTAEDSEGVLEVSVTEGIVSRIRTVASGPDEQERINQPEHQRLLADSPLKYGWPVRISAVERHMEFLSRHPRRQVDLTLEPGREPGDVEADYVITEEKPWTVYGEFSNTGTPQTSRWRQRIGWVHYNLTGADDIFWADYLTAGFDQVHALNLSYERPLRSHPRIRWKAFGGWSRYTASDVGVFDTEFRGESMFFGGEINWNFLQRGRLFVDAVGGLQFRQDKLRDDLFEESHQTEFLLPYAGIRASRNTSLGSFSGSLLTEFNMPGLAGTSRSELDGLGRMDTDRSWFTFRADVGGSVFLEPLLDDQWGHGDEDPTLAHQLKGSIRGQYTPFGRRLTPTFTKAIGGATTVRGYPESFASGDSGIVATVEYRVLLARLLSPEEPASTGNVEPATEPGGFRFRPERPLGPTDWNIAVGPFMDVGRVWQNDQLPYEHSPTLISAGVGAELLLWRNISARLDWGVTLKSAETGSERVGAGNNRLHLNIRAFY